MPAENYPYLTPQILNDVTFAVYGGNTGSATPAQRQAAYTIAEMQASQWMQSFLTPTTVTGTYVWYGHEQHIMLDYANVLHVEAVNFLHADWCTQKTHDRRAGVGYVRNADAGIVDVNPTNGVVCSCWGAGLYPYQVEIVYRSGMPTGTSTAHPSILMALTTGATLVLNEIVIPGVLEGYIGVQSYISMGYQEVRKALRDTPFGSSAAAQYAAKLLEPFRRFRARKFGR